MEQVGGVPVGERLANVPLLQNFVRQAACDLEVGAPPKKQAPLIPALISGALELLVVDRSASTFARAFAWRKLVKFWAARRTSDLTSLSPTSLKLGTQGLCGWLERTKTSGPGKMGPSPADLCFRCCEFIHWRLVAAGMELVATSGYVT